MLEVLDSEYVTMARAKGANHTIVLWKHAFRNAILQPLTTSAIVLASFVTGAVVIERDIRVAWNWAIDDRRGLEQ